MIFFKPGICCLDVKPVRGFHELLQSADSFGTLLLQSAGNCSLHSTVPMLLLLQSAQAAVVAVHTVLLVEQLF